MTTMFIYESNEFIYESKDEISLTATEAFAMYLQTVMLLLRPEGLHSCP